MKKLDYKNDRIGSLIVKTSTPMLVAELLNLLYSIVDRIYIGRINTGMGSALSGIGLCFPFIIIITGFSNMFGMGGSALFSIELGKGDKRKATAILNTTLRLAVISAAILTVVTESFSERLLTLFGADAITMGSALPYLRIYMSGTIFVLIASSMYPFINAEGFPRIGMTAIAVGTVLNIILDPLFIFALDMGVRGAAIATVISQAVSACVSAGFLLGKQNEFRLTVPRIGRDAAPMLPYAGNIVSLGTAPFIMSCTNSLVSVICNRVLMFFGGSDYVSVMTIITSIRQILDTPVSSVANGTSPIISFNYGNRQPDRIRQTIVIMVLISLAYTAAVWALIELWPGLFIGVFTNDPHLTELSVPAVHIYFFAFIFQGFQHCGQAVFKALNKKKQAIFFSLFRKVILVVPLTYLLPYGFGFGTTGVFLAEPISNFLGGAACFTTMVFVVKRELYSMRLGEKGNGSGKENQ